MREAQVFLFWLLLVLAFFAVSSCAISDARQRGKSALFVWIAVVFFFPFGLLAWLLFRPARRT